MTEHNITRPQAANYNLLKSLAIFMVIAVHMLAVVELMPAGNIRAYRIHEIVRTLLLTSNGLFFMISGRFLLEHYDGRIGQFYWKRTVKIGIPVLMAAFFYYWYVYGRSGMGLSFWKGFVKDFLQCHIQGYFWFVFALAGFYLAVPFLAAMFRNMSRREKAVLIGVTAAYFFIQNLYQIFELEMALTSYPFYSWLFYCVLGYLLDSLELSGRQKKMLILAGGLAFLVSAWEICFWNRENPSIHNYSVTMILLTGAVYLAVTTYGKRFAERWAVVINFISRRSFYIYLMHGITQFWLGEKLSRYLMGNPAAGFFSDGAGAAIRAVPGNGALARLWLLWFGLSVLSYGMALAIGCVLDWIYEPLSGKLIRLKWPFGRGNVK